MSSSTSLDLLPLRQRAEVVAIDWTAISDNEGRRLRALGIETGVQVEKLYKGMFGMNDPIALRVGRMMIAVRKSHARAIAVCPVAVTIAA